MYFKLVSVRLVNDIEFFNIILYFYDERGLHFFVPHRATKMSGLALPLREERLKLKGAYASLPVVVRFFFKKTKKP